MKTENRVPSIQDSALRTRHLALRWGEAMKNILSILLVIAVMGVGARAEAQQPKKVSRLGYLSNTDAATDSPRAEGIRLALRDLGYIEGQNIAIEYRYAEGKVDRAPELAAELVASQS